MHILALVLGLLAAAAFWYFRLRTIHKAGSEVIDHLGRARGQMRRNAIRRQVEESPVAAIDDPVVAAASLLCMIAATAHPLTPREEEAVREQLSAITSGEVMDEAIVYGRWVQRQGLDAPKAIRILAEKLNGWLTPDQMAELGAMIDGLEASPDILTSKPRTEQARRRLRLA